MVITSENKPRAWGHYGNTQFRYALTYVFITFFVLIFLNIYCSQISQQLFYQSKEVSMVEKCLMAAAEINELEVLNRSAVASALTQIENPSQTDNPAVTRVLVTDLLGKVIYDSAAEGSMEGQYALLPEIVSAMQGNNVFFSRYSDGVILSRAAAPLMNYETLNGCVYMLEYDTQQGALIQSLEANILMITVILELAVIIYSAIFSGFFSGRIRRIMASMRIIREGDYSHKVHMGGHDELTVLGDEFNDLTDRLLTSENKRRQFVSDASHELKTPLASIKLLSDSILQNDMDMETVKEFVGDIGNEADRLNRMSQKLLSLSRVETQEDGLCEIVPMAPTVERVVRMLDGIAKQSHIRIVTELEDDCPILILEDDLYQITFNLVENGIKYNRPGGELRVKLSRQEDNALLQVSDSGVGIPEDAIGHVFERFYRVDKARSRKSGGSGLGLAIVKSMVERNGGTISVESQVGIGTTFTVSFPAFDTEEVAQ